MSITTANWIITIIILIIIATWRWINLHDTSMGSRKILSLRQESNPQPTEHRAGALSTELRELMESEAI